MNPPREWGHDGTGTWTDLPAWHPVLDNAPITIVCRIHIADYLGMPCSRCGFDPTQMDTTWAELSNGSFLLIEPRVVSFLIKNPANPSKSKRFSFNANDPQTGQFV